MKNSMKWAFGILGVFIVFAGAAFTFLITQVAPVGSAYAAKRLCSCVFISKRTPDSVLQEELGRYGYVGTSIDHERKTVTGSILGLAKRTAVYREGLGCTLAVGAGEIELRQQTMGYDPTRPDTKNLPGPPVTSRKTDLCPPSSTGRGSAVLSSRPSPNPTLRSPIGPGRSSCSTTGESWPNAMRPGSRRIPPSSAGP